MATTEENTSMEQEHVRPDIDQAAASQPSDTAESLLEAFVHSANWGILHPADLERFEQFMTLAHRAGWLATTVEARLLALGLPAELCGQLRRKYWNRTRPLPTVGTKIDSEIAALNARLTRRGRGLVQ